MAHRVGLGVEKETVDEVGEGEGESSGGATDGMAGTGRVKR